MLIILFPAAFLVFKKKRKKYVIASVRFIYFENELQSLYDLCEKVLVGMTFSMGDWLVETSCIIASIGSGYKAKFESWRRFFFVYLDLL